MKPKGDLRNIIRSQITMHGVQEKNIDDVFGCTVCDKRGFPSFRREGDKSRRMISVIEVTS